MAKCSFVAVSLPPAGFDFWTVSSQEQLPASKMVNGRLLMSDRRIPFPLLFAEKMPAAQDCGPYDELSQTCERVTGLTHYETATGGHGDTDTDTDP
jgi:hypothetical protein